MGGGCGKGQKRNFEEKGRDGGIKSKEILMGGRLVRASSEGELKEAKTRGGELVT